MNRREFIAAAGIGTATALAGCAGVGGEEPTIEELNVEEMSENTIRVDGRGAVETDPDQVTFAVAVESSDPDDASAVIEDLARRADELRSALLEYGVPEDDITTARYSLRENSRNNRFEGEHRYNVELDDPDAIGEVIDLCVEAGADSVGRIHFTISDERREELYDEAVENAVEDARNEAELYASAADVSLGEPVSIETTKTAHAPFRQQYDVAVAEDAGGAAATQIDEGQVSVVAQVTIEYRFE